MRSNIGVIGSAGSRRKSPIPRRGGLLRLVELARRSLFSRQREIFRLGDSQEYSVQQFRAALLAAFVRNQHWLVAVLAVHSITGLILVHARECVDWTQASFSQISPEKLHQSERCQRRRLRS